MAYIILITGGQRSGKSSYAQQLAVQKSKNPVYLATAHIWDEEFRQRIENHRLNRDDRWQTIEEEIEINKHHLSGRVVLLDCITLWLTNIYTKLGGSVTESLNFAKEIWQKFINQDITLIVVTNEIGMGIIPDSEVARKFADLQGWFNQYLAAISQEVYLMVSGIQVKIKANN